MRSIYLSLATTFSLVGLIPVGASAQGGLATRVAQLEAQVAALEEILRFVHVETEEINELAGPHWIFEGINVHVRSGSGLTADGCSAHNHDYPNCESLTGLGNLIVGYNEPSLRVQLERAGSHNLVVGERHSYSSFAGLVAGRSNTVSGANASVSGGSNNRASGDLSSVGGGSGNRASGLRSSVSGGLSNEASGGISSVSGGFVNEASGQRSSVSGGHRNQASGLESSVSGGALNEASGTVASVSGGALNEASGADSSVSGGQDREAPDDSNWAAGNLFEEN